MKKSILYANGCSHTAGGGMEYMLTEKDGKYIHVWKELYGFENWGDEKNIMYPQRIADHFKLKCINEASSGSGAPRTIRKTYEYIINKGVENLQDHIFLLQFNNPVNRIEYYCRKIDEYLIINPQWGPDGKVESLSVTENYSVTTRKYHPEFFKDEIEDDIKIFLEKYHEPIKYYEQFIGQCAGLISFLEQINVEYFYMFSDGGPLTGKLQHHFWNVENRKERNIIIDGCRDISEYADKFKLTIEDDTKGILGDRHAGYFAQIEYGKKISEILQNKFNLEININKLV
jgi:hypothetical protein